MSKMVGRVIVLPCLDRGDYKRAEILIRLYLEMGVTTVEYMLSSIAPKNNRDREEYIFMFECIINRLDYYSNLIDDFITFKMMKHGISIILKDTR